MKKLLPCLLAALLLFTGCGSTQTAGEELLKNGSFEEEQGTVVTDWLLDRYDSSDPRDNFAVVEDRTAPDGGNVLCIRCDTANDARFVQTVPVTPGKLYRFSAWVKTEDVSSLSESGGANLSVMQSYGKSDCLTGTNDWTEVVIYGKPAAGQKTLRLCLRLGFYSADATGTVWFDNVSFTRVDSVPEGFTTLDFGTFEFNSAPDAEKKADAGSITGAAVARSVLFTLLLALCALFLSRQKAGKAYLWIILGAGLLLRLVLAYTQKGFSVDVRCFASWANLAAQEGLGFYDYVASNNVFCDYPPLYLFFLGLFSLIRPFQAGTLTGTDLLLLKLPAIAADLVIAWLLYRWAVKKSGNPVRGLIAALLYTFLPAVLVDSACWGQIDSILVLLLLGVFLLLEKDRFLPAVLLYLAAVLTKPQALIFGPVMLLVFLRELARCRKEKSGKRLAECLGTVGLCAVLFLLVSLLLKGGQDSVWWLLSRYLTTLSSYAYGSLSSFGLMALLGGQWVDNTTPVLFGLSYKMLGTVGVVLTVALVLWLFLRRWRRFGMPEGKHLVLLAALLCAGAVLLASGSHERYLYPVLGLLLFAWLQTGDKRLLGVFASYSLLNYLNVSLVLHLYEEAGQYMGAHDWVLLGGSLLALLTFGYHVWVTATLLNREEEPSLPAEEEHCEPKPASEKETPEQQEKTALLLAGRGASLPHFGWKDALIILLVTAVYAAVAFYRLGDTDAPQTFWQPQSAEVSATADLGEEKTLDALAFLPASAKGNVTFSYSVDGQTYTTLESCALSSAEQRRWNTLSQAFSARYVRVAGTKNAALSEVVLLSGGTVVPVESVTGAGAPAALSGAKAEALFDSPASYGETKLPETAFSGTEIAFTVSFPRPVRLEKTSIYAQGQLQLQMNVSCPESSYTDLAMTGSLPIMTVMDSPDGWVDYSVPFTDYADSPWISEVSVTFSGDPGALKEILFFDDAGEVLAPVVPDAAAPLFDEQAAYPARGESWRVSDTADYVIADLGKVTALDHMMYEYSVSSGSFDLYYSQDGTEWTALESKISFLASTGHMYLYEWHRLPENGGWNAEARYVAVVSSSCDARILEIGLLDRENNLLPVSLSSCGSAGGGNLLDEQALVPVRDSFMNGTYFDEIYHARTAYESLNGMSIYEWTHPPLGKDIMSVGIAIFGMNPFGWRFMGTLAGVLMLPAMYVFGKLLFKKKRWASVLMGLMTLDGMHFVQTRIATIDSYGVLFILLMFLTMYWYYSISFYEKKLWQTFIPLGLCGICFGLGAASKWIGLYAGAGLAVLFFFTMFRRWREYKIAREAVSNGNTDPYLKHVSRVFPEYFWATILFCIGFFVAIPLVIYCASYYPYFHAAGETRQWYQIILDNQKNMFVYHSTLDATHFFQSPWYSWPVIYKPMWFYQGKNLAEGSMECISCFGNPAVWYAGLACTLASLVLFLNKLFRREGKVKQENARREELLLLFFCFAALFTNLIPWIAVTRCVFIYHYFASVPFIMVFTVYILTEIEKKKPKAALTAAIALLALALVLFVLFYPVWSGLEVSKEYVNTWLRWFPTWYFGS